MRGRLSRLSRLKHHLSILNVNQFDAVTKFRLINAFMVSIGLSLLSPVITILKGTLLAAWAISFFMILSTLSVKTNLYFSKKGLSWLYKVGVIVHILFIVVSLLYFWSPFIMIILDSVIVIVEIAIFSAYGIRLNVYLTENFPDKMEDFQIHRNGIYADGTLIGLGVSAVVTSFYGMGAMVIIFTVYNSLFAIWMIKNWNFFDLRHA